MGHFRVYLEPVLKRVLVQNLLYENKFDLHENKLVGRTHFHMNQWFRTKSHFDPEAKGKSEMKGKKTHLKCPYDQIFDIHFNTFSYTKGLSSYLAKFQSITNITTRVFWTFISEIIAPPLIFLVPNWRK